MRTPSCLSGKTPYRTRRAAVDAHPGVEVFRCDRCRCWHVAGPKRRGKGKRR